MELYAKASDLFSTVSPDSEDEFSTVVDKVKRKNPDIFKNMKDKKNLGLLLPGVIKELQNNPSRALTEQQKSSIEKATANDQQMLNVTAEMLKEKKSGKDSKALAAREQMMRDLIASAESLTNPHQTAAEKLKLAILNMGLNADIEDLAPLKTREQLRKELSERSSKIKKSKKKEDSDSSETEESKSSKSSKK